MLHHNEHFKNHSSRPPLSPIVCILSCCQSRSRREVRSCVASSGLAYLVCTEGQTVIIYLLHISKILSYLFVFTVSFLFYTVDRHTKEHGNLCLEKI